MDTVKHRVEFCVVGGGLAGLCAAVAAARHGVKTLLMHDRPVLGGNASSEIRMWVSGAHGCLESGLIEELRLENCRRNPGANYSIWDSVLYGMARFQDNLELLLNTACLRADMDGSRILRVAGYQTTTQLWHEVEADWFADCSGDSVLAPLTGAEFRVGREARAEFGESIEPEVADRQTMGMSCLIQAREMPEAVEFTPPEWAYRFSEQELAHRPHDFHPRGNFWWLELGGDRDSIRDTESVRDELLKVAFGLWDHIKNGGDHGARNWTLDWVGFLPGKRESRRCLGDHLLTQNDVRSQREFEDIAAYGGWTLDDHHPAGFRHPGPPNIHHPCPSPFAIPYRCLYSRNVANLYFAGRNISVTHAALSATRVMATCALLGQAVGTAAAVARRHGLTPRGVFETGKYREVQMLLMDDDCFLPGRKRPAAELSLRAALASSCGNPAVLLNGIDREWQGEVNALELAAGDWAEFTWPEPAAVGEVRIVFDSDLGRDRDSSHLNMHSSYPLDRKPLTVPETLVRAFHLAYEAPDGTVHELCRVADHYQRVFRLKRKFTAVRVRLVIDALRGAVGTNRIFAFEIKAPDGI